MVAVFEKTWSATQKKT